MNEDQERPAAARGGRLRVVTFNILFNLTDGELPAIHQWKLRKTRVLSTLQLIDGDILCLQELTASQREDLLPYLSPYYGILHQKSQERGCWIPILFRHSRLNLLDHAFLPLTGSEECEATLAIFSDKANQLRLTLINTHLDYRDIDKRLAQVKALTALILKLQSREERILLAGDLNTFPLQLNNPDIPFQDGPILLRYLESTGLRDSLEIVTEIHHGPFATTNWSKGYGPFTEVTPYGPKLDHILIWGKIRVETSRNCLIKVDGHFPSDHLPYVIDLLLLE